MKSEKETGKNKLEIKSEKEKGKMKLKMKSGTGKREREINIFRKKSHLQWQPGTSKCGNHNSDQFDHLQMLISCNFFLSRLLCIMKRGQADTVLSFSKCGRFS